MSDTAAFVIHSFSFLLLLPSVLSTSQILFVLPGFQRIFGFLEVSNGQGLLFRVRDICVRLLFGHISPFSVFSFQGTLPPCCGAKMFSVICQPFPLCVAAGVSALPALPAGYGLPAVNVLQLAF